MSESSHLLAHFLPEREWIDEAACVGAEEVFFPPTTLVAAVPKDSPPPGITLVAGGSPETAATSCKVCAAVEKITTMQRPVLCDVHADPDVIERAGEHAAKRVCLGCDARVQCLMEVMAQPHQPPGVVGGLNRWERQKLQSAGREELAELDKLRERLGEERCLELREHFEATGPDKAWLGVVVAGEVAVRHGVPLSLAQEWMSDAPGGRKNRGRSAETITLMERLGDGEWVERDEVEAHVLASLDDQAVEDKAAHMGVSPSKARAVMFNRAVEARRRRGSIEEREIDGVWWMRLRQEQPVALAG